MIVENGGTYRFKGTTYLATVEDSELSGDTSVSFQRLPIRQEDDEPSVFLNTAGDMLNTEGEYMGDASELQRVH